MVGMILAEVDDIRSLFSWDILRYTIVRLVILPGIIFAGCRLAGIDRLVTGGGGAFDRHARRLHDHGFGGRA